jgi:hypothetical protein
MHEWTCLLSGSRTDSISWSTSTRLHYNVVNVVFSVRGRWRLRKPPLQFSMYTTEAFSAPINKTSDTTHQEFLENSGRHELRRLGALMWTLSLDVWPSMRRPPGPQGAVCLFSFYGFSSISVKSINASLQWQSALASEPRCYPCLIVYL